MKTNKTDLAIENTLRECHVHPLFACAMIEQILENGYKHYSESTDEELAEAVKKVDDDWEKRNAEIEKENAEREANGERSFVVNGMARGFESNWVIACVTLAKNYSIKELAHYLIH